MLPYKVGEPFPLPIKFHMDGAIFEYTKTGPMVILAFTDPSEKEIQGLNQGRIEIGLYEREDILFLPLRVEHCGKWMDMPFSIRKYDQLGMPFDWSEAMLEEQGLALLFFIVDRRTHILRGGRLIGTSNQFGRILRKIIMKQLEKPFSEELYNKVIEDTYLSLSSEEIAARAECMLRIKR